MIGFARLLPLLALLAACSGTADKLGDTAEHAFDMPTPAEKGYAALAAGNNPIAVRWFLVALKDKPDDPYLMLDLAAAYQNLAKFDDARQYYQKVIDKAKDVTPDNVTDPNLKGKNLADIAAANLAKLPPPEPKKAPPSPSPPH